MFGNAGNEKFTYRLVLLLGISDMKKDERTEFYVFVQVLHFIPLPLIGGKNILECLWFVLY